MLVAIDTSDDHSGVALYDKSGVLAECAWRSGRRHAEQALPTIDLLMRHLDRRPDDLTAVAVATGPGSWSGLRVGMSLAKALALAHNLPILGIPTLDVLAYAQRHRGLPVMALVRLGRDRYGAGVYRYLPVMQHDTAYHNLSLEELPTMFDGGLVCGEVDPPARALLAGRLGERVTFATGADNVRRPGVLAELAWERLQAGESDDLVALEPLYLGSPVRERGASNVSGASA